MPDTTHETVLLSLLLAGVVTFVLGVIALTLLRRAIARNMAATGGGPPATLPDRPRRDADTPLAFAVDTAATATTAQADRILRRMLVAHAAAGLVFAIVATLILLPMTGSRLVPLAVAAVTWAFAWPTVIVLSLVVGPDRRVQGLILLGYFGVLLALCVIAGLVGTQSHSTDGVTIPGFTLPLALWVIYATPSLFLLLFLNRTIRAIGPLVLVFAFVLVLGANLMLTLILSPAVVDSLPVFLLVYTLGIDGLHVVGLGLGMLLAAWPAWRLVVFLRDRHTAKRSSSLLLIVGTIWLMQTLVLANFLFPANGWRGAAAALLPLVAWQLALYAGLRPLLAEAQKRPPARLLLLRVFGFGRRSRRLLDLLGTRWRLIGSIDLIAAPDLASHTVEPSTFLAFIQGRLARLFIRTPDQLTQGLAALDHQPDPDARFRINQLFCSEDMWRDAVARLMGEASLVVMDLRGFGAHHRGCVYELQTLLDTVPIDRLAFLFDQTTDRRALETLLTEHWQRLDATSPNITARNATLRLLNTGGGDTVVVHRLLAIGEATARL